MQGKLAFDDKTNWLLWRSNKTFEFHKISRHANLIQEFRKHQLWIISNYVVRVMTPERTLPYFIVTLDFYAIIHSLAYES